MIKKSSGKIQGPDYPFGQTPEYFCAWQVQVVKENKIRISISYKSTQGELPCFKHYLQIFDGPFPTNRSLGRTCLNTAAAHVTSTGPDLYIMLWIDSGLDEESKPIFSASYEEMKGIISGFISSTLVKCLYENVLELMVFLGTFAVIYSFIIRLILMTLFVVKYVTRRILVQ